MVEPAKAGCRKNRISSMGAFTCSSISTKAMAAAAAMAKRAMIHSAP